MLSVSALYSVAMNDETGAPVTEDIIFSAEKAYLTEEIINEDGETVVNLLAARTMNLKVKGDHLYAGEPCPLQDAKFVYVLNVVIADSEPSWEGMALGLLTLPEIVGEVTLAATATVTRADDSTAVIDAGVAYADAVGNVVAVNIPTLSDSTYTAGDSIWISVMIQTQVDLSDELDDTSVTEVAWNDPSTALPGEIDVV